MPKYTYEEVKQRLNEIIQGGGEPELKLLIYDKEHMVIGYKTHYSFQKLNDTSNMKEINFNNLDELYNTETIDNIFLKRDWNNIDDFELDGMDGIYL